MRKSLFWFFLCGWMIAAPFVQGDEGDSVQQAEQALQNAQHKLVTALNQQDFEAAAGWLHPGYVHFAYEAETPADWSGVNGSVRQERLARAISGYETWKMTLHDVHYRVAGNSGVASGALRIERKMAGWAPEMTRRRFTETWVRQDGKWLLLSSHRSPYSPGGPEKRPTPKSDAEKKIIEVAEAAPRHANATLKDVRLLRLLVESMNAQKVVELGTSTGYSGLWMLNALRKTGGTLYTFEIDDERADIAQANFEKAGVADHVKIIRGDAHKNLEKVEGPIDLAFIDAEKPGYRQYLEQLMPKMKPGGLILGHNMRFPTPAEDFVEAITTDPRLDTIFEHMAERGVSVSLVKR